jgi:hypothetical protein
MLGVFAAVGGGPAAIAVIKRMGASELNCKAFCHEMG